MTLMFSDVFGLSTVSVCVCVCVCVRKWESSMNSVLSIVCELQHASMALHGSFVSNFAQGSVTEYNILR